MISVDYRSGQPLYRQIKENFKRLILSGAIAPDERLPSVRELASQLAINPNTIQRAYRELEADGFIGTSPGRGVYAAGGPELRERKTEELYAAVFSDIKLLLEYGQERAEILRRIGGQLNETEVEA